MEAFAKNKGYFADNDICSTPGSNGLYVLPPLPYDYSDLEPYVDTLTMQLHHDKHFNDYTTKLNAAINNTVM